MITNTKNGKFYIGSSVNIRKRFSDHKRLLANNIHGNRYLQRAYNKYGKDAFEFKVMIYCSEDLREKEQEYIDSYNPEYNIVGTVTNYIHTYSEEQVLNRKETRFMNGNSKLNRVKAIEIINHLNKGESVSEISRITGISRPQISSIKHGRNFKELSYLVLNKSRRFNRSIINTPEKFTVQKGRRGEMIANSKLKEEEVVEIINRITSGEKMTSMVKDYNVSYHMLTKIKQGLNWKHIPRPYLNKDNC